MEILDVITGLSREFGDENYVKGGGGNTSCKNESTLWVKPSGTTLSGMNPETFVAMDRKKIDELYSADVPADKDARETLVKDTMAASVLPDSSGRPSVEAPLHNVFEARYVVHTHPALVNGLTCAKKGKEVCAKLFPEALWFDYTDPGYTLCMGVRNAIEEYKSAKGKEPQLVVLENHGIFIAADSADEIRALYAKVMAALKAEYEQAGVSMEEQIGTAPADVSSTVSQIKELLGADAEGVAFSGPFKVADGPISPDHIVYSKSYAFKDALNAENMAVFKSEHGYAPRVIVTDDAVFGVGSNQKNAELSLLLAQDGSLVMQLTEAFGGLQFMSVAAREFIENWEVESYRAKIAEQG